MSKLEEIGHAALSSIDTLTTTFNLARLAIERGVAGDFVECGVFGGAQCAAMALAIMRSGDKHRRVHLFDSFEGIPAAGPHDAGWGHEAGQSACSLEAVQSMMKQWGIDESLLAYHVGWFKETIPFMPKPGPRLGQPLMPQQIAVLRLDADLYDSTRTCIEHLYPLVSPGGWIIVDDFSLPGCRKAVDDFMKGNYPPVYWQKPNV